MTLHGVVEDVRTGSTTAFQDGDQLLAAIAGVIGDRPDGPPDHGDGQSGPRLGDPAREP